MRRLRRPGGLAAGLLVALLLAPAAPGQTGPRPAPSSFAFQTHVFRWLLSQLKFHPLQGFDPVTDPADTVLVVLGDTSCLDRGHLPGGLREFVAAGGACLVATDRKPASPAEAELEDAAGVTVTGRSLVDDEEDEVYRGLSFCPFLDPLPRALPDLFRGPRLDPRVRLRVATNAPSSLRHGSDDWPGSVRPLAFLPANVRDERMRPRRNRWLIGGPLFAAGGEVGRGRVLVLADHSLFINEMMLPEDTGNVEFTSNCLEWLRGERDARRHQVLFVEDGAVRTDLDVPLKEVPGLPPGAERAIVAGVDRALADLQEQNAFNRGLWEWLGPPAVFARRALAFGTLLLALYLLYRAGVRGRYRPELAPLLARAVERHTPAATLLEQRGREAVGSGNLWEAARGVARAWVAALPAADARPPRVEADGGWWRRRSLERRVRRMWKLAHAARPVRVSPRGLRRLLHDADLLRAALADGTLRLKGD
jgi:hypothetical protein